MHVGLGADLAGRARRPRLWAESVETTSVRWPSVAARMAVAAERLVLPTPPLPE